MLLTIVAIWAIVIPLLVLAISWQAAKLREANAPQTAERSLPELRHASSHAGSAPACAVPAARSRRTITRRVCPELPRGAGRRPASA
jgi:hypothetical protein